MLLALEVIVGLIVLVAVAVTVFIYTQAKENVAFYKEKRTKARLTNKTDDRLDFEVEIPFENIGQDDGIMLDSYVRIYLPDEQYDGALVRGKVNCSNVPREDDYFEAMIVKKGAQNNLVLKFEVTPRNGKKTAAEAVEALPDFEVALFSDLRGREGLYTTKTTILLTKEELQALLA